MVELRIKVNLKIFLFIILVILTKQIELYCYLMLFLFIHEIGHLIVGILCGFKPKELNIMPFGASISFKNYENKENEEIKKAIVALAGPLVNIIIAGITCLLDISEIIKLRITYTNIIIALFNLITIYPLDGGRILKSILQIKLKRKNAECIVNKISNATIIAITILCSILILYYKNIAILIVIAYLWYLRINENKKYILKQKIYDIIEKT